MNKKAFIPVLILLIASILLSACGGGKSYNVSGKVIDLAGNGLAGVKIVFTGGISGSVTTTVDGNWTMAGLKGTVKVTPVKTGWYFNPGSRTVTGENTGVNFEGSDQPEGMIKTMLDRYCAAFNDKDANAVVEFFHPTYYTTHNLTVEEHLNEINSGFDSIGLVEIKNYEYTPLEINGDTAEMVLRLGTELNDTAGVDYIWEISLERLGWDWLITDKQETVFEAYVERPYIEEMIDNFLDGVQDEDIQVIASLTSENYSYLSQNKAEFLEYMEELFERLTIYNYEREIMSINPFEMENFYVQVVVYAYMSTDGLDGDRELKFSFVLIKEAEQWKVQSLSIEGDPIKIFETEITEDDGESDYIPVDIAIAGRYYFETSILNEECDTVLYLYAATDLDEPIGENDDISPPTNRFSLVDIELEPGTYYVKVEEFEKDDFSCKLVVTRVGL